MKIKTQFLFVLVLLVIKINATNDFNLKESSADTYNFLVKKPEINKYGLKIVETITQFTYDLSANYFFKIKKNRDYFIGCYFGDLVNYNPEKSIGETAINYGVSIGLLKETFAISFIREYGVGTYNAVHCKLILKL